MSAPEIRIDPLSGLKVIVAHGRAKRPGALSKERVHATDPESCPFCEGREHETPPEVWALGSKDRAPDSPGWSTRVFPNKFPALAGQRPSDEGDKPAGQTARGGRNPEHFSTRYATGAHEVIVHAPDHRVSISELNEAEVSLALKSWSNRLSAHKEALSTQLVVNEGRLGGASLEHTHAQLYALPLVPSEVAREREHFTAYADHNNGACLMCDLVQEEIRLRQRVVAVDESAVLLAPFASRLPYQLQVVPRRHGTQLDQDGGEAVAPLLHEAFQRLVHALGGNPPLNAWVRTAPRNDHKFHWRIDIVPRLTHLAGLELSSGLALNVHPPEMTAEDLAGI